MELVGCCRAGLDGPAAGDTQLADRFDRAGSRFGYDGGLAVEHRPSGRLGVDGIGLASSPTVLTVGSIDLDHGDLAGAEVTGEARTPRPGAFHPHGHQFAVRMQPTKRVSVAVAGGGEALAGQRSAHVVDDGNHVDVFVGVDAADDTALFGLRDGGHRRSLSLRVWGGMHPPGRRTGQ